MRLFIISSFFAMLNVFSCHKQPPGGTVLTDIMVTKTLTPSNVLQGNDIVSKVTCMAPNPCYSFYEFEVTEMQPKSFKVKAKALYDTQAICAQVLYQIDTTLRIKTPVKGQYILNFYNTDNLFKSDTVVVN